MKRGALILCVVLAGCERPGPPPDAEALLQRIEELQKTDARAALGAVNAALRKNSHGDDLESKLCVRKSMIVQMREGGEKAIGYLNSLPPMKVPFAEYRIRRQLAALEAQLGRFEAADGHLLQAIELARAAGKPKEVAGTEVTRSRILLKLHRADEAQACLNSAQRYSQTSNDHSLDQYIEQYKIRILLESNRFEPAIAPLEASYAKLKKQKKLAEAAKVAVDLGWAYYRLGQLNKAQQVYENAERDLTPGDRYLFIGHLGNIYYDRGLLAKAAANYKKAAELSRNLDKDSYSTWISNLATTLTDEKHWSEAARYNSEALAIGREISGSVALPHALVNAGRIAAGQHDYATAEQVLCEVSKVPGVRTAPLLDADAELARVYAQTNRPAEAKRQFETALHLVDTARTELREDEDKLTYLESLIRLNQQYVEFLMERNDVEGAFQVSEMSRARVLRDRLAANRSAPRKYSVADYQKAARDSGSTYIAYWVAPERSFVWVITGTSFQCFPLPGEQRIRDLVERHQRTLERGGTGGANALKAAEELFDVVAGPLQKALPAKKRLVIVPDGPLYGLNFETLRSGSRYWIEDATIAAAPSLELMLRRGSPERSERMALIVGDALETSSEFPKLLNAGKEMARIGRQFSPKEQLQLAGAQATPTLFLQSDPAKFAYIHFAAHAFANGNAPLDSSIILSGGRLSVKDVLSMPVHARLVTVSGCSSAGARTYSGEGLVGLAWAFLQSGAHGVVAGLWDVSDYSSPVLMEKLYAGLAAGKEPADALRFAKLKLLEPGSKYADPYYWGAFQLYLGGQ